MPKRNEPDESSPLLVKAKLEDAQSLRLQVGDVHRSSILFKKCESLPGEPTEFAVDFVINSIPAANYQSPPKLVFGTFCYAWHLLKFAKTLVEQKYPAKFIGSEDLIFRVGRVAEDSELFSLTVSHEQFAHPIMKSEAEGYCTLDFKVVFGFGFLHSPPALGEAIIDFLRQCDANTMNDLTWSGES